MMRCPDGGNAGRVVGLFCCAQCTGIQKPSPWVKGLETRREKSFTNSSLLQVQHLTSDIVASSSHGYPRMDTMEELDGPVKKLLELPLRLLSCVSHWRNG